MKNILGHRSWSFIEIVDFFVKTGTFTMCVLPHYRFQPVKDHCRRLQKAGLIKKSGRTDTAVSFKTTKKFRLWMIEADLGITELGVIKWAKAKDRKSKV